MYLTVADKAPACSVCHEHDRAAFPTLDLETGEVGVLYASTCGILCKSFQDLRYQRRKAARQSLGAVWKAKYPGRCRVCEMPFVVGTSEITKSAYGGYAHADCEAGV